SLLLGLPIHKVADGLGIVGGLYLVWSVNRESAEGRMDATSYSMGYRLRRGTVASFFLNVDAAVTNSTLTRGHLPLLLAALLLSAIAILALTVLFSLAGEEKTVLVADIHDAVICMTAGYVI